MQILLLILNFSIMKKNFFKFLTLGVMLSLVLTGCPNKDDDPNNSNNSVPDPEGTITVNLSEYDEIRIRPNDGSHSYIMWCKPDNLWITCGIFPAENRKISICDLGPMKGLGNITQIPSSGFTIPNSEISVACEKGHGYVIKSEDPYKEHLQVIYVRLYVVESIISTNGGIMGAKVKYQYPFVP